MSEVARMLGELGVDVTAGPVEAIDGKVVAVLNVAAAAIKADQASRDLAGTELLAKRDQVGPAAVRDAVRASVIAGGDLSSAIEAYRAAIAPPITPAADVDAAAEAARLAAELEEEAKRNAGGGEGGAAITDPATIEEALRETTSATGGDVQTSTPSGEAGEGGDPAVQPIAEGSGV